MNEHKKQTAPRCIGVIMDGNRRWAKEHGKPSLDGHRAGYEKLKEIISWSKEVGVEYVIFYAFSTENWSRQAEEVSYLMNLFETALKNEFDEIKKENVRIKFIGQRDRFSPKLQNLMNNTEKETVKNSEGTAIFAMSYGGHAEITQAINTLLESNRSTPITEDEFSSLLWTEDIPDPDLIIRTGGEMRLSNFLPWQSAYSELFFTKTYWPDFSKKELFSIIQEFSTRERRRGK